MQHTGNIIKACIKYIKADITELLYITVKTCYFNILVSDSVQIEKRKTWEWFIIGT